MNLTQTARKILVVDDNDVHRYALSRILGARGVEVLQAASGKEALELAKQEPDIALVDIHLSDMTGYALLEQLRAQKETAGLPIILISATEPAPTARNAAQALGVSSFLTLPVVPDDLWIVIEATLQKSKRRAG